MPTYTRQAIDTLTLELLGKHAGKLNRQIVKLELDLSEVIVEPIKSYYVTARSGYDTVKVPRYNVAITVPDVAAIVKPGYELIALAQAAFEADVQGEHTARIMTRIGDESVDLAPYRNGSISCDECGTVRRRKTILILRETATARVFGVGTDCAEKYIPRACSSVAILESLVHMAKIISDGDPEEDALSGSAQSAYDLDQLLAMVAVWTRKHPYIRANECGATKDVIFAILHGCDPISREYQKEYQALSGKANIKELRAEIAGVKSWVEVQHGSDYTENLKAAFSAEIVVRRTFGLVISSVSVYRRAVERQREEAAQAEIPQSHFGTVGVRFGAVRKAKKWNVSDLAARPTGTVTGCRPTEGYYGTTHKVSIALETGQTLIWWSSQPCILEGRKVAVTATVKKHDDYRGKLQTVITRATLQAI